MIRNLIAALLLLPMLTIAQERVVKVDFQSGAFVNNPLIPFDKPFMVEGEVNRTVEYVTVNIYPEGNSRAIHSFSWNRDDRNPSELFSVQIPGILRSNSKYDFEVITYTLMTPEQKQNLTRNLRDRIAFYIRNNYKYDGKNVGINNPQQVYRGLTELIHGALANQKSKNNIANSAPSLLVLEELKNHKNYRFKTLFKRSKRNERDDIATQFINDRVNHLTELILSEIQPFINTQLVQHHRSVKVRSVQTDKESFSLPVNFGMYAWNKSTNIDNVNVGNTNFTPGVGFTVPFSGRSTLAGKRKLFDSFGYSMGILLDPVRDAEGTEFITPGVNLPVYAALGFRLFKVVRLNAGALIIGERGLQGFNDLTVLPTVGLALELNLWMGIKK